MPKYVLGFLVPGLLLLLLAAVVSNAQWEHLAGRGTGTLAWGPSLFRIMLALHGSVLTWLANRASGGRLSTSSHPSAGTAARTWWILGGLMLASLGLRLWRLESSLWLDEVLTMVDFARSPVGIILTSFPNQNQHMLYSLLAHLSLVTFGESAWALRLPAVAFGVASLWALFLLGRTVVGTRESLLACGLMAVSYHHIWFSQNARGYTGVLLFATLATWLWLEARNRHRLRWWLGYAAACFLGLWIHSTMIFLIAAHGLMYLLGLTRPGSPERRAGWMPWAAWALCATVTLQALSLALPEFLRQAIHEVSPPSEWRNPMWMIAESMRSLKVGFSGGVALLCAGLLFLIGWVRILKHHTHAAMIMTLPGLLGGAVVLATSHNLWPRFFFFSMGFALLVVVHGAVEAPKLASSWLPAGSRLWAQRTGLALAGVMIVASAATVPRCYRLPKQDYTGARDYVERNRTQKDIVITAGLANHAYSRYYAPQWPPIGNVAELKQWVQTCPTLYLVFTLPAELKGFHPELWAVINTQFRTVQVFPGSLGGGEIYVSRLRKQPASQQ